MRNRNAPWLIKPFAVLPKGRCVHVCIVHVCVRLSFICLCECHWMCVCNTDTAMQLAQLEGRIIAEHCLGPQTFHIKKWKGNLHYYQWHITSPLPPPLLLLYTALTAWVKNTSHWQEIPLFLMPQCQQHTSDRAKKKWKKGKGCERERRGVKLTTMPEWQDRRKPGNESIQVPVGPGVRRVFGVSNVILGEWGVIWDLESWVKRMNHGELEIVALGFGQYANIYCTVLG